MKVDILVGQTPYQSTVHFSKGLAKALERLGVETRLFWVDEGHFFHAFYEITKNPPHWTCSFSDLHLNQQNLGELWRIPHLSMLIDPAIYFLHQLKGEYSRISCVDPEDIDFLQQFPIKAPHFLPHGVDREMVSWGTEKEYQIVFFGSCIDYESVAQSWFGKYNPGLLFAAAEQVLSPNGISILKALTNLGVSEDKLPLYHHEVDLYTRGKDRVEILRKLKGVHVWGEGPWKKYCPEATVYPPIDFMETLEIMKRAKVVVNSSPRFKQGSHERILYALLSGAAVFTGENGFVKHHFPHQFTYQYGEWEVEHSFDDWECRARVGQEAVLLNHTWDARAPGLINYMSGTVGISK